MHSISSTTATDSSAMAPSNRRTAPRIETCIPSFLIDKKTLSYSTILNFSEQGMLLSTPFPLEPDDEIELIIKPKNAPHSAPIHLKLDVKHCRQNPEHGFTIGGQLKQRLGALSLILASYCDQPNSQFKQRLNRILA
ncbi:MAG: PilZ domain-containing protein [Thiotrichales bacterium]|nr:PilZ domain-containing protein [Thiotrichales bacterium]